MPFKPLQIDPVQWANLIANPQLANTTRLLAAFPGHGGGGGSGGGGGGGMSARDALAQIAQQDQMRQANDMALKAQKAGLAQQGNVDAFNNEQMAATQRYNNIGDTKNAIIQRAISSGDPHEVMNTLKLIDPQGYQRTVQSQIQTNDALLGENKGINDLSIQKQQMVQSYLSNTGVIAARIMALPADQQAAAYKLYQPQIQQNAQGVGVNVPADWNNGGREAMMGVAATPQGMQGVLQATSTKSGNSPLLPSIVQGLSPQQPQGGPQQGMPQQGQGQPGAQLSPQQQQMLQQVAAQKAQQLQQAQSQQQPQQQANPYAPQNPSEEAALYGSTDGAQPGYAWNLAHTKQVPIEGPPPTSRNAVKQAGVEIGMNAAQQLNALLPKDGSGNPIPLSSLSDEKLRGFMSSDQGAQFSELSSRISSAARMSGDNVDPSDPRLPQAGESPATNARRVENLANDFQTMGKYMNVQAPQDQSQGQQASQQQQQQGPDFSKPAAQWGPQEITQFAKDNKISPDAAALHIQQAVQQAQPQQGQAIQQQPQDQQQASPIQQDQQQPSEDQGQ